MNSARRRSAGFSIIELLIAITLGLLLTLGLINVFINSKQAYRLQEATARMQENGRFATDALARAIRLADFWGSAAPDQVTLAGPASDFASAGGCDASWLVNPAEGLRGYEGGSTAPGGLPSGCITAASRYVPASDAIAVRYADPDDVVPTANLGSATGWVGGNYFVRTLTGRSARLVNGRSGAQVGVAVADLPDVAGSPGAVINYRFRPELYYLALFPPSPTGTPTLYFRRTQNGGPESTPLVDGVEMMNFEYGVDTNDDLATDRYMRAATIDSTPALWGHVLSVRVSLLIRGDEVDNFVDTRPYQMAGGTPDDEYRMSDPARTDRERHFLRTLIVKEVQVRNRVRIRGS